VLNQQVDISNELSRNMAKGEFCLPVNFFRVIRHLNIASIVPKSDLKEFINGP